MNPILSREIRARFRDKRSFWLLFGLTALLCLTAAWIYQDASQRAANAEVLAQYRAAQNYAYGYNLNFQNYYPSLRRQADATGRELFRALALGNALAWLLIAPALTATGLAKERERGLLESLWLSPFRVRSQIAGRMGATLLFLFILQVAALPVYGIAVLLGGVSLPEIGVASAIIAVTALVGASLGMWCSARAHRPANALGAAFFLVAGWSAMAYSARELMVDWSFATAPDINFAFACGHPLVLMQDVLSQQSLATFGAFTSEDILKMRLALPLAASWLLLWSATRKASHPLPEARWQERSPMWQRWRARLELQKAERKRRQEAARLRDNMAGALLYEVPVERLVRFRDPLLAREVKARFRLRAGGFVVSALRIVAFIFVAGCWIGAVFSVTDTPSRAQAAQSLLVGLWACGMLSMGVMSGSSLTRERESGTWEGLKLSLLRPAQIVRSKWLAPLVAFAYWSAPLWILLPLFIKWNSQSTGISFLPMLGAVLIVIFSLGAASALGLWISSRAPHSAAGTSWTLAVLLVIVAGFPVLDSMVNLSERVNVVYFGPRTPDIYNRAFNRASDEAKSRQFLESCLNAYHPFLTLEELLDERETEPSDSNAYDDYSTIDSPLGEGYKTMICLLNLSETAFATALLLFFVTRRVRKTETP